MANAILPKYSAVSPLTITLASLASSAAGVGRQSTVVDNTTTRYKQLQLGVSLKLGTSPAANTNAWVYLIRDDGVTNFRTDGAGTVDAVITVKNAQLVGNLTTGPSPATGDVIQDFFVIDDPGPKWAVAIVHNTTVGLDSTAANHTAEWIGIFPEVQ